MDVDQLLSQLSDEVRDTDVEGSWLARVYFAAGLYTAASIIEQRRIELLCQGVLSDVEKN